VKKTFMVAAVLFSLSLPMWAGSPYYFDKDKDKKKKQSAVPEGGNWPAYVIVSGAALLGGLILARKQRETGTLAGRS
jgi:hypothetical protein